MKNMFPLKLVEIRPLSLYKIGRSLLSRKKDRKKSKLKFEKDGYLKITNVTMLKNCNQEK